jgi:hypothetical protein
VDKWKKCDGGSVTILKELVEQDRNWIRMSDDKFKELMQMVGPKIQKGDNVFRTPILARMKLEPKLRHLASGR